MDEQGGFSLGGLFDYNVSDVAKAAASKLGLSTPEGAVKAIGSVVKGSPDAQKPAALEKNPIIESGKAANGQGPMSIGGVSITAIALIGIGAFLVIRAMR